MPDSEPKHLSNTLVIVVISGFFILGVGHLYIGQIVKGILLAATTIALYAVVILSEGRYVWVGVMIVIIGLYIYQLVDIWRTLKSRPNLGCPRE